MAAGVAYGGVVLPLMAVERAAQGQTSSLVWMPSAGSISALTSTPKSKGVVFPTDTELCAMWCLMHGHSEKALLVALLFPSC